MKKTVKKGKEHAQKEELKQKSNKTDKDSQGDAAETTQDAEHQANEEQSVDSNEGASTPGTPAISEKIEQLESSLREANEKFLRLFSEFDNYRKRVARERIELTKTASESIITAMLPVLDDLERAAKMSADNDADAPEKADASEKEGINLIYNKFKSILRQKGVEEITALGEDFDTDYHDAITHIPAEDKKQKGKVIEEVQKGYTLNGKVIRYASVVVAN